MKKNDNSIKINLNKKEIIIFFIVGLTIFLLPLLFTSKWGAISFSDTGSIGDTIGGITAPFLAFFGSILVYLALKAQVEANKLVQDQFTEQKKVDYRQNFENTFFNLLSTHHQIVGDMDFETNNLIKYDIELEEYFKNNESYKNLYEDIVTKTSHKSRDVFDFSLTFLFTLIEDDLLFTNKIPLEHYNTTELKKNSEKFNNLNIEESELNFNNFKIISRFSGIYYLIYDIFSIDFGHYFRNLYRIIKLIDEKQFSKDRVEDFKIKYSYTSIIRSQLSNNEIQWLFFNCLSQNGAEKFKLYLEKYSMLKVPYLEDNVYIYYSKLYRNEAFRKPKDLEKHIKECDEIFNNLDSKID